MNETQINAKPRDKYWAAVYLRMTAEAAEDHGLDAVVVALLQRAAQDACEAWCIAQVEADELDAAIKDD